MAATYKALALPKCLLFSNHPRIRTDPIIVGAAQIMTPTSNARKLVLKRARGTRVWSCTYLAVKSAARPNRMKIG